MPHRETGEYPARKLERTESQRPGGTPHGQMSKGYLAKCRAKVARADEMFAQRLIDEAAYLDAVEVTPEEPAPLPEAIRPNQQGRYDMLAQTFTGPRFFESPEMMRECVLAYFEWNQQHPIQTNKPTHYQGKQFALRGTRLRMMSIRGLCLHIGISDTTWYGYRDREGFVELVKATEDAIYAQKIEGAAADEFNVNLIMREIGLRDQTDITSGGESLGSITRKIIDSGRRGSE